MNRSRVLRGLSAAGALACLALVTHEAGATKFRRPFNEEKSFNYAFDEDPGSGCKNWNCLRERCYDGHKGTDYPLSLGTQVVAGANGTVTALHNGCPNYGGLGDTCGGGCGNYVKIRHADGYYTMYCHLQINSIQVSNGQSVTCGQVIARSASSGSSTGPHLHFAWRNSGNTNLDPYAGSCSATSGAWVGQGSYSGPTSAQCECQAGTEVCNGQDDDCDGSVDEDDVCEQQMLLDGMGTFAPPRTTDIDGDGLADVCGRGSAGFWCHRATGSGFTAKNTTLGISDAEGWGDATNWGTIRMGDVDGDGRADVCARSDTQVHCWKSDGANFTTRVDGPTLTDDNGWKHMRFYSTMRLADIDGDGKDDLCARAAKGLLCWKSTGDSFGSAIDGPAWSDDKGYGAARHYGTLRMGDINGDGKADACIRGPEGIECFLSDGNGFPTRVGGPSWADSVGWGGRQYWSTIRLADVNGDGRDDICARAAAGLRCHFSNGTSFGDTVVVADLSDSSGWNDPSNYLTLRTGDIDGDGAQDLCIRANAQVWCYRWDGSAFASVSGPAWSDGDGWDAPQYYQTITLADVTGDGRDDVCGRFKTGWVCAPSTGNGFGSQISLDEFTDSGGWGSQKYYGTIRSGGPRCWPLPEVCNGRDDDCDGIVDEGCAPDAGPDVQQPPADSGTEPDTGTEPGPDAQEPIEAGTGQDAPVGPPPQSDASAGGAGGSDTDASVPEDASAPGKDAGKQWNSSGADPADESEAACACRATGTQSSPAALALGVLSLGLIAAARRSRNRKQ